jgi:hypothetical protein
MKTWQMVGIGIGILIVLMLLGVVGLGFNAGLKNMNVPDINIGMDQYGPE